MKTDLQRFLEGFKKFFPDIIRPQEFIDVAFVTVGLVRLDVIKFDDFLIREHGNYCEDRGQSMSDVLLEKYGQEARDFIKSFI